MIHPWHRVFWAFMLITCAELANVRADDQPTYVGAQACAGCHAAETDAWKGSHHALAMQPATEATVLGDFSGAKFEHFGVTTTFYRAGERFMVRTDGPDGKPHEYPIAYTFGVQPLQQYLIEFPKGRYQVLGIAWDSRSADQGGHRWYHLYPDQKLTASDPLHWTGRDQTWNYMCADCHSTNVHKNFDLAGNTYTTTWTDVDVACEACHGPGSRHVAWSRSQQAASPLPAEVHDGLVAWLNAADRGTWAMNEQTGIARRTEPPRSSAVTGCLRRLSHQAKGDRRGQHGGDAASRPLDASAARARPVPCRRADRRRSVRGRLIHPEPDVRCRRHLHQLPRPACRRGARLR